VKSQNIHVDVDASETISVRKNGQKIAMIEMNGR